jgi:hypothetical protein
MKTLGILFGFLVYFVLAIAPTVGIIWVVVHFARKFW